MRVLKCTMHFNPKVESSIVPIWAKLPELPYCLFHKEALVEIANAIGRPLKLDHEIETQNRPSFARICVEIDIMAGKLNSITIEMGDTCIEQRIIDENIPRYCTHCKHLGHDTNGCKWIQQLKINKESEVKTNMEENGEEEAELNTTIRDEEPTNKSESVPDEHIPPPGFEDIEEPLGLKNLLTIRVLTQKAEGVSKNPLRLRQVVEAGSQRREGIKTRVRKSFCLRNLMSTLTKKNNLWKGTTAVNLKWL